MMNTTRFQTLAIVCLIALPLAAIAQNEPTPTATSVPLSSLCSGGSTDPSSRLINGDFEADSRPGFVPLNWDAGSNGLGGTLVRQADASGTSNNIVQLRNGFSITQVPVPLNNSSGNIVYTIRMCALVSNGYVRVTVGGQVRGLYPEGGVSGTVSGEFETLDFRANISNSAEASANLVEITFLGNGVAYIDNVEMVPYLLVGGEETPEPTPTLEPPSPTPTPTQGEPSTATPTLAPGLPTYTPTPKLTANSVQVTADPPLLLLSPDDFTTANGAFQQVLLDTDVIGANGQPIDVSKIDKDATIKFTIDTRGEAANVGTILERREGGNNERLITTQEIRLADLGDSPVVYKPLKPYDGTIRIIVDIQYTAMVDGKEERIEIRGVVPIISRTRVNASILGSTGSFNASRNSAQGRQPGDRGFRPDQRTNLYFRELLQ